MSLSEQRGCLVCLQPLSGQDPEEYHARCLRRLFGVTGPPLIDVELAKLHTLAGIMVQHTSISGVQRKISLGFSQDRAVLRVPGIGGDYILKPQTGVYPSLPENEHVTMALGELFGLEIPPCGLVRLADASLAYIVKRFDRTDDGGKRRQEDFCQLAVLPPKEKYEGSAELCSRVIRAFSDQPGVDLLKLYRQLVFSWWVGNHDLHLKNLALLAELNGPHRLSPAYDLVSTAIVIDDDHAALTMGGRDRGFSRAAWLRFAGYCGLPVRAAERVLQQPARLLARAEQLIGRSWLPEQFQQAYVTYLRARTETFSA